TRARHDDRRFPARRIGERLRRRPTAAMSEPTVASTSRGDRGAPHRRAAPRGSWLARAWRWIALRSPQGVLAPGKPRTYREMLRVVWENRRSLPYAWRILTRGVCDGCALGPRGLHDDVIPGVHLC